MKNYLTCIAGFTLLIALDVNAKIMTPMAVEVGSKVNNWPNGCLTVTKNVFDLAIEGEGFFAVKFDQEDDLYFTRSGEFNLDRDGYIVHKESGAKLIGLTNDRPEAINIAAHRSLLYKGKTYKLTDFKIPLDGTIVGQYENIFTNNIKSIALALFENSRRLTRLENHLFKANELSGKPYLGYPITSTRGRVASAVIEQQVYDYPEFSAEYFPK